MNAAFFIAAALSSGLLGNVIYDVIKRFVRARETFRITVKVGNRTLDLDARKSTDAEKLIEAVLARAHSDAATDRTEPEEDDRGRGPGEAKPEVER